MVNGSTDVDMTNAEDNSSEATLVSMPSVEDSVMVDAGTKEQQQHIFEDTESLASTKKEEVIERLASPEKQPAPLTEAPTSKPNAQAGDADAAATTISPSKLHFDEAITTNPPSRAPPVPPPPPPLVQNDTPLLEEYARQQDVTEVISHSLFQLSCAIKPTGYDKNGDQIDQIHDLFYGKLKSHVIPEDPSHNVEERFLSIIARLSSLPHDIYAALDGFFDVEELDGGTKRYSAISQLPPVFQIHFDRVGYDTQTNTFRKLNHHVDLKETIYLDRYLEADVDSSLMERRQQTWQWKAELAKIRARQQVLSATSTHPDAATRFDDARSVLLSLQSIPPIDSPDSDTDSLRAPLHLIENLAAMATSSRAELARLTSRAADLFTATESNFTDMRSHAYRLHAAFFHRGTHGSGHYWVYIYDFAREIWRKYNDGYVHEVRDTNEIFRAPSDAERHTWSGPANPYFLVYVRDDMKDKLVESVHRDIVYAAPPNLPPRRTPQPGTTATVGIWETLHSADVVMRDSAQGTHHQQHDVADVAPVANPFADDAFPVAPKEGRWDSSEANARKW
jgi:ubiquitin carboxyl-terminal hydrolase 25